MRTYQLFIEDDRYTVPTLKLVLAANARGAREAAEETLLECPNHLAVEGFHNSERLFRLTARVAAAPEDARPQVGG